MMAKSFNIYDYENLTESYMLHNSEGIKFKITTDQEEIKLLTSQLPPSCTINNAITIPVIENQKKYGTCASNMFLNGDKIRIKIKCDDTEKLILSDFPSGQYTIIFNDQISIAQQYDEYYIFDLTCIEDIKKILFDNFGIIEIICNFSESKISSKISSKSNICVLGKYIINNQLSYGYVKEDINFYIFTIHDNWPHYQYLIRNITLQKLSIRMSLNFIVSQLVDIDPGKYILIRFDNEMQYFNIFKQNQYLSEELNKNTINMSVVDSVKILFKNPLYNYDDKYPDLIEVVSTAYITYNTLCPIFSN
jgi:hypothetical protein